MHVHVSAGTCGVVHVLKASLFLSLSGLKAMAHIWYEVIQELRYRWENGIPLPR